ncbi:MAG: FadR family transcriptional regulator [Alphaproteobacteria bacterium]|nr:FadR family transcriptional regulator [Alphaproteobacteria bacterium]
MTDKVVEKAVDAGDNLIGFPGKDTNGPPGRGAKMAIRVAQGIVREIAENHLMPGAKLPPEHEMVERYGVARATLREALRYLELQGVLTIKPGPGGGPVVDEPHTRNLASTLALMLQFLDTPFRSLIELRQVISPGMAAMAARNARHDDLERLRECITKLRGSIGDIQAYQDENRKFHDLIAWASGNPAIGLLVSSVHLITNSSGITFNYSEREQRYQIETYESLYQAIAARDPDRAQKEMQDFIGRSDAYVEKRHPELMRKRIVWEDIE